jgi:hypothetical protein
LVARDSQTQHELGWALAQRVTVGVPSGTYSLGREDDGLVASGDGSTSKVGSYARLRRESLVIRLTPGCQNYFEARAYHGNPVSDEQLVAALVVASVFGHPDADKQRAGTKLSAVWSHHLAVVLGDDPRRVANTYAPTETAKISGDLQHLAVTGVAVTLN